MKRGSYNIFNELAKWSKDLEAWQQASLLLLLTKGEIGADDFKIIYEQFKQDRNLLNTPKEKKDYSFDAHAIPKPTEEKKALKLKGIKNVKGVNALASGQVLNFGDSLTVIYGPNGAGKSGYARALKAACFTRSKDKNIYGNIHILPDQQPTPSADFILEDGVIEKFEAGKSSSRLIDNFAVFDSSCIRIYTDEKNEFNVSPYGFDVFPQLAGTVDQVRTELYEEIKTRSPDLTLFKIENSNSEIAQFLNELDNTSDIDRLKVLSKFGEPEEKKLEIAEKRLQELAQQDPAELVKQKTRQLGDLRILSEKLGGIQDKLTRQVLQGCKDSLSEYRKLKDLQEANSVARFGKEPVQPIGTAAWLAMVKASIEYNREAYPGEDFPPSSPEAKCVLCHQSLDNEQGRDRLAKFYNFLNSDVESKLNTINENLVVIKQEFEAVDFYFNAPDTSLNRTLEDLDKQLLEKISNLVSESKTYYGQVLRAIEKKEWKDDVVPSFNLIEEISELEGTIKSELEELKKGNIAEIKTKLESEIQSLKDKLHLKSIFPKVEVAIKNCKWIKNAEVEAKTLTSKSITDKQKAMTKELLGKGFIEAFTKECSKLKFSLPIEVKISGALGTTKRQIEVGSMTGGPGPSKILSEGEQTAVALADFLTEVQLDDRPLGIIFDDPVTSMDHLRKELIGQRLVEEAKERQVIVFTHDILFTSHLAQAAEAQGVRFAGRTVSLGFEDNSPGYVGQTVFPHSYYENKSADDSQEMVSKAKGLNGNEAIEKLLLGCGMLRTAYEEFIQKQLFNDAINRWREELKPFALENMYYDEEIILEISQEMGKLSRYIESHSHSPEGSEIVLGPQLLQDFIDKYRKITKEYKRRADIFRKEKSKTKKETYE